MRPDQMQWIEVHGMSARAIDAEQLESRNDYVEDTEPGKCEQFKATGTPVMYSDQALVGMWDE